MPKGKLEKHLAELEAETSGGAHDSITASGKGIAFLEKFFKSAKKRDEDEFDEDDLDDDDEMDEDDDEDEEDKKSKKSRRTKKSANGGELEEEDEEDLEDPGQKDKDKIIANRGKRVTGEGAVKKNARDFDKRRFAKSLNEFEEEHEEVLDATPALTDLTKHVRSLAKSHDGINEGIAELHESIRVLAKGLHQSLKAQASMAADLEVVKNQPVSAPASGFVVMTKNSGGSKRRLSKSDVHEAVTDALNDGLVEGRTLARLQKCQTETELRDFVESLPASVQERL